MKWTLKFGMVLALTTMVRADEGKAVSDIYSLQMKSLDGQPVELSKYKGKVVLFVNVASQCGYTPQYAGLQKLHERFKDKGLVVVGVPANEFGRQEPGSDSDIREFCTKKYGVTFEMLSKVVVKGPGICPLYQYLTTQAAEKGDVSWNFEKFLVNKRGEVVGRYKSRVQPDDSKLIADIEAALR